MAPTTITRELIEQVDEEFSAAKTAEEVREVFKRHVNAFGWKRLCRLFVLEWGVDELWLAEESRSQRAQASDD